MLKEGLGFRATARYLKISNTVVLKWFKNKSLAIKELLERNIAQSIKDVDVVEIDELWHYTQKNSARYGYGLLMFVPREKSLPMKLVLGVKRP